MGIDYVVIQNLSQNSTRLSQKIKTFQYGGNSGVTLSVMKIENPKLALLSNSLSFKLTKRVKLIPS